VRVWLAVHEDGVSILEFNSIVSEHVLFRAAAVVDVVSQQFILVKS